MGLSLNETKRWLFAFFSCGVDWDAVSAPVIGSNGHERSDCRLIGNEGVGSCDSKDLKFRIGFRSRIAELRPAAYSRLGC